MAVPTSSFTTSKHPAWSHQLLRDLCRHILNTNLSVSALAVQEFFQDLYDRPHEQHIIPAGLTKEETEAIRELVKKQKELTIKLDPRKQPETPTADARQEGGDHYKKLAVQPWDAMEAWLTPEEFRGFLKGNILKYIARANSGKEDHDLMIAKAGHYQQKLDEMLVKWKSS